MKTGRFKKIISAIFILAVSFVMPDLAGALTASGVSIANKATINYQVNGINQTLIESSPTGNSTPGAGSGTNTTFLVDDKVIFTVTANDAGFVTTYPGSTSQAMTFTVSNTGNTTHDFTVSAAQVAGFTFTPTSIAYYTDNPAGIAGTYEPGVDTLLPIDATNGAYVDELAAGSSAIVYVVATVPVAATNGQISNYTLSATAYQGGGAAALGAISATTAADNPAAVDIVLAEAANVTPVDAAYNGVYIVTGVSGFKVSAASLTITKAVAVYSDPISGTTNPKAIPGAVVTYTITIANAAGAANATNVSISDSLAAEITATHITFNTAYGDAVTTCAAGSGIVINGACKTNSNVDADGADFTANVVNVSGLTVNAGSSAVIKYQVVVQ